MRRFSFVFLLLSAAALAAPKPTPKSAPKATPTATPSAPAAQTPLPRPQFRPAVLASGRDSLINRIDVKALLEHGQKSGAVQFAAGIGPDGMAGEVWTYHAMPDCKPLEEEVLKQLAGSRFTPPLYNSQPVTVVLYGTVVFDAEQTPHVRIFLNQDPEEIKAAHDFIGPQPVIGADSDFKGLTMPEGIPVALDGIVDVEVNVDAKGNLREFNVLMEDPPLLGFADAAINDFQGVKFIPGFRDGDATESKSIMSICYKPVGVNPDVESLELRQKAASTPSP